MTETKRKLLNNGREIPYMGLGTHRLVDETIVDVIYNSIKDGLRLIDNAPRYKNEKKVGEAIQKAIKDKICTREDLVIISKIWLNDRENPEEAVKKTLNNLQLDKLDICLDHWPSGKDYRKNPEDEFKCVSIYDFWPKMEKLVEKGLTKSIGVSNYNIQGLNNLLSFCTIKPVVNEVEYHLFYHSQALKEFCDKENIAVIAYCPLGHGIVGRMYIAEHYGEFDNFGEKIIKDLAKKYNKNEGQIILNWEYHQGIITIPATDKTYRFKSNSEALTLKMDDEDYEMITKYYAPLRKKFCVGNKYFGVNILG